MFDIGDELIADLTAFAKDNVLDLGRFTTEAAEATAVGWLHGSSWRDDR